MSNPKYSHFKDAAELFIIPAVRPFEDDYDIRAIFDDCFTYQGDGFVLTASHAEFWNSVEQHDRKISQ